MTRLFAAFLAFTASVPAAAEWRAVGPFGGSADFVRISITQPDVLIAGTRRGMLFRSGDGGVHWVQVASPVRNACSLNSLEIHPKLSDTWFAGLDCEGARGASGLYRTSDRGQSWSMMAGLEGQDVRSLAFSGDAERMAAGTADGVYVSRDGGLHWNRISPESNAELKPVVSLAYDPEHSQIIYAGTTHLPWSTRDGGTSWMEIHDGMLDDSDVFSISPDARKPGVVYASACSGVYRSDDRGSNWIRLPTPRGAFRTYLVAVDPHTPGVVFAATSAGLLRSEDAGQTWRKLLDQIVKSIAFHPQTPGRVFIASSTAGLLSSLDGISFRPADEGFSNRVYRSLAGAGGVLYASAGGEAGGLFRTVDAGGTWTPVRDLPGNAATIATAGAHSEIVLASVGSRVLVSTNKGDTWKQMPELPGGRVVGIAAVAEPSGVTLLAATPLSIYRAPPAGTNWERSHLPSRFTGSLRSLEHSGQALTAMSSSHSVVSVDGGRTWDVCGPPVAQDGVYSIAAAGPSRRPYFLAATSEGLFRSEDGCRNWTRITNGLGADTVTLVAVDASSSEIAFAVQNGIVFRSVDYGRSWTALADEGRFGLYPTALHVDPSTPSRLYALFPGRGVLIQDTTPPQSSFNSAGPGGPVAAHEKQGDVHR